MIRLVEVLFELSSARLLKVYSAAFATAAGASSSTGFVLVDEVKEDLEEMYAEVSSGKMTIPSLDRSIDFSNDESPRPV